MTIKEVAQLAGVSPAAVSRYFNGGSLGEEKQNRIREVIERTGYSPNPTAQTMRTGKSGQIGVIVPKIHSDSLSQIMSGIAEGLHESNYIQMLGCTEGDREKEIQYLEAMQRNQVEGIILMGTVMTPRLKDAIRRCAVPVVVTGQNFAGIPCVYHDDFNAMRELTERMIERGREHVVFIGVMEEDMAAGLARKKGVQQAWKDVGMPSGQLRLVKADFSYEGGKKVMKELLREDMAIDGVICASDLMALGAMSALRDAGKRLPEEVSVVGIGDSWAGNIVEPKLTTAHLYYKECGSTAVDILLRMLEAGEKQQPIGQMMLGYTIIERGSL
ncbi:MAG: LacI family DNA-binding transcriptional regulator [Lachnospiraceae bacterium]|nr:LacI family DNA-binding transcriptional regulator [Lachnospiraceae bacterium]